MCNRFNGQGAWSNRRGVFESEQGEPFIIYFQSDEATTNSGFQFTYSEQRERIMTMRKFSLEEA